MTYSYTVKSSDTTVEIHDRKLVPSKRSYEWRFEVSSTTLDRMSKEKRIKAGVGLAMAIEALAGEGQQFYTFQLPMLRKDDKDMIDAVKALIHVGMMSKEEEEEEGVLK